MRHILSSSALTLMLIGRTNFRVRVLRGLGTLLGLLALVRLVAHVPTPFGNEFHIWRCKCFHMIFLHLEVFPNYPNGLRSYLVSGSIMERNQDLISKGLGVGLEF